MSARWQRALTLLIVLYLTFVGGTAYAHTGAIPDAVRLIFIAGPLGLWLAELLKQHRALPRTPLDRPLAAAAIWLLVAALLAQDRRISLEMTGWLLAHILGFYLLVDLLRQGWARHFKAALLAVALGIVLLSVVEIGVWEAGWLRVAGLADPVPPLLPKLDLALNITTIEGNYAALLIPLIAAGALARRDRRARIALGGLALLLLGVEVFTFSRGGLLGTLVGLALLVAFALLRWERIELLLRPSLILAGMLALVLGAALLIMVWSAGASRGDSDRGRLDAWNSALDMARDDPLTGVGPGLFGLALRSYRDPALAQDKLVSAHNLFLNTLAETGVPGLLILLWVGTAFAAAWWSAWRRTSLRSWRLAESRVLERRIALEGVLAAGVAYTVHSLVDTFPLTSSVLPLLIMAAYSVAEPRLREKEGLVYAPRWRIRLSWALLALLTIYTAAYLQWDVAQGWMTASRAALADGDLRAALDRAEKAERWDPTLSLYDLHDAYVLGRLAAEDPGQYLDRAIDEQLAALDEHPTFDLGWANLGALYQQRGEADKAREAFLRAAGINPRRALYWFKLGDMHHALKEDPDLAEYAWPIDPAGVEAFLRDEAIPAGRRLYAAVRLPADAPGPAALLPALQVQAEAQGGWMAHLALGMAAHRLAQEDDAALRWLNQAIREHPADERPWLERAAIELARGDLDAAERDARTARWVDPYDGAPGNFILAQIARQRGASDAEIERLLRDSVRPRPVIQYFAGTVYARPGAFDTLPQLAAPGMPQDYYAGWLALAQFYAERDRPDDAARVYRDLLALNPALDEARAALDALAGHQK